METQPRKRDADRSRAEILDAAERLFAAQGFDVVTMADIGAAAGVSRGTPGYFFGQKEQLYRVVLERAAATFRMLGETLRARHAGAASAPATVVGETVEAFVGLLVARPDIVRLLDRDAGATVGAPHAEAVAEALASLGDQARPLALTIVSVAWYPVAHPESAAVLGADPASPDFAPALTSRVLTAVAASPSAAPVPPMPAPPLPAPGMPAAAPAPVVAPKPEAAPTERPEAESPDARFVHEVVVGDKKKKKKKKKKG